MNWQIWWVDKLIKRTDIIDAILSLAAARIPELVRIYIDLIPAEFARPSLFVQPTSYKVKDASARLVQKEVGLSLTVYGEIGEYDYADARQLLSLQDGVMGLFQCGYLRVLDRVLPAKISSGGRNKDSAFVDVSFSFLDDRDDKPDEIPLMEEVKTKIMTSS